MEHLAYCSAPMTGIPLATHPGACLFQSGMPGSSVAVREGTSLLGRRLLPRVRPHSALSAVSWRSDLRGATNTQRLRRQNFCSLGTSPVELSSGPAAQSRHHLWTVQTTAEGKRFSGSMNTALCDFWYASGIEKHLLTYLLTYDLCTWDIINTSHPSLAVCWFCSRVSRHKGSCHM